MTKVKKRNVIYKPYVGCVEHPRKIYYQNAKKRGRYRHTFVNPTKLKVSKNDSWLVSIEGEGSISDSLSKYPRRQKEHTDKI